MLEESVADLEQDPGTHANKSRHPKRRTKFNPSKIFLPIRSYHASLHEYEEIKGDAFAYLRDKALRWKYATA
jgi:hypothetical protein